MRVSIVTVSFNQAAHLEEAIASVLAQDYPHLEYIVVDAGSSDGSRELIEAYGDRIDRVIFEGDDGPADGLNKGFSHASGDVFAYLNSDDVLLSGAVSRAVEALEQDPEAAAICGNGYLIDRDGELVRRFRSTPFRGARRLASGATIVMQQSTFVRADAFRDVGGFNRKNRTCWDTELLLDLALAGRAIRMVDGYWSLFRWYPESISGAHGSSPEFERDRARMLERALGRPARRIDGVRKKTARFQKWLTDPRSLLYRVRDTVRGVPTAHAVRVRSERSA